MPLACEKPQAFDLSDGYDLRRLFRESAGYIRVYCGGDAKGRQYAIDALLSLAKGGVTLPPLPIDAGAVIEEGGGE